MVNEMFKINAYFDEDCEEIEKLISIYIIAKIEKAT